MTEGSPVPNLDAIKPEVPLTTAAAYDNLAQEEVEDYRKQEQKARLDDLQAEVENRKRYTTWLFWLMVGWIVVVLGIILLTGLKHPELRKDETGAFVPLHWYDWFVAFDLPEGVLLALIGGTTANVIGLFLVVARYLFPRRNHDK